jgi:cytochrome c551/c552
MAAAGCHEVDKKLIGPAFQDVAAKYKGDKDAAAKLRDKVKKWQHACLGRGRDARRTFLPPTPISTNW